MTDFDELDPTKTNPLAPIPTKQPGFSEAAASFAKTSQKVLGQSARFIAKYSQKAYVATRDEIERRRVEAQAKRDAKTASDFDALVADLVRMKPFMGSAAIAVLDTYPAIQDLSTKAALLKDGDVQRLRMRLRDRRDRAEDDKEQDDPNYRYTTRAGDLLNELNGPVVDRQLKTIANKYKTSNAGQLVSAAINGSRNPGGALVAIANSAQVGAHNGAARTAFTATIRDLTFSVRAGELEPAHRVALRLCKRLEFLDGVFLDLSTDDLSTMRLCHFSLVYANGHAAVRVPEDAGKFGSVLYPEFHNTFHDNILTISSALNRLQKLTAQNTKILEVLNGKNLMPFMKHFADNLPSGQRSGINGGVGRS